MTATLALSRKDRLYVSLLNFCGRQPLSFLQRLGAAIGWLAYHLPNASPHRVARCNLELCFPEKCQTEIKRMTRANLMATTPAVLEMAKSWGSTSEYSASQIRKVHNEHLFHEALAAGKGTLAIAPHFGTFEIMNAWLHQFTPQTIMYKPVRDKGVNNLILTARSRYSTILPADESGVRGTFKVLKQGGFCAILPDQVPQDNGGIYAPFFGISTWTGILVPRLVSRTGCTVLMMSCIRRPNGDGFELYFDQPDEGIYSEDLLTSATAMNRTIETLIRRAPEHYYWFYKRFKKNEVLPDPYRRK